MSNHHISKFILIATIATIAAVAVLAVGAGGAWAVAPVKVTLNSQFGREVDLTHVGNGPELEDLCTVASKDECRPGAASGAPGGFYDVYGVAGTPGGNVYVVDGRNHRVQELTAGGQFVLMFGREVNETTGGSVCTHEEEMTEAVKCKAVVQGGAPGELDSPYSVAVDPVSGDVYVAEFIFGAGGFGERVQKFTAQGQFLLEIGREVNEKTHGNLCTHEEEVKEAVKCTAPASYAPEPGSFNFESNLVSCA